MSSSVMFRYMYAQIKSTADALKTNASVRKLWRIILACQFEQGFVFGYNVRSIGNKNKRRKMRIHQSEKLVHGKGNDQQRIRYRMEENIHKPCI